MPPPDYDHLSDGSELTGDEQLQQHAGMDDDESTPTAPRSPSKNRRRVVHDQDDHDDHAALAPHQDDHDLDAEGEVDAEIEQEVDDEVDDENQEMEQDQVMDDDSEDEFRDELADDDDQDNTSAAAATAGTARSRAASKSGAGRNGTSTPTKRKSAANLKVTLRRSPTSSRKAGASTPAKNGNSNGKASAPSSSRSKATSKGRAATAAASAKPKNVAKIKWKARATRGGRNDDDDDDDENDEDDEDPDAEGSASPTLSALGAGDDGEPLSGSDDGLDELEAGAARKRVVDSSMIAKTARQLARENKELEAGLLELPMTDESKKRKLTENELALRRSETARKRKNQSEKKLEDDKIETINRLLKKQVGRSRSKLPRAGSANGDSDGDDDDTAASGEKGRSEMLTRKALKDLPAPLFRYVNGVNGSVLGVPAAPPSVAGIYPSYSVTANHALVQEIQDLPTPPPTAAATSSDMAEKLKRIHKKQKTRLGAAKIEAEQELALQEMWGDEGAYEFTLRRHFGLSRKAWIGDRQPVKLNDEEEEEEAQEHQHDGVGDGEGEEKEVDEAAQPQDQPQQSDMADPQPQLQDGPSDKDADMKDD
ncbi:hypothetical protein ACQY0O_006135 [Thecaphora frezii]